MKVVFFLMLTAIVSSPYVKAGRLECSTDNDCRGGITCISGFCVRGPFWGGKNHYCTDVINDQNYSNVVDAKTACLNEPACNMIVSSFCKGDNWRMCKGEVRPTDSGHCTYIKDGCSNIFHDKICGTDCDFWIKNVGCEGQFPYHCQANGKIKHYCKASCNNCRDECTDDENCPTSLPYCLGAPKVCSD